MWAILHFIRFFPGNLRAIEKKNITTLTGICSQNVTQFINFIDFESAPESCRVVSSTFWILLFRNKQIPDNNPFWFLSISFSFEYAVSKSAKNKGTRSETSQIKY